MTIEEKVRAFRALHERPGCFIIPNPWDAGSARMLAALGFEALATTSAGFAFSRGVLDGAVRREQVLAHCAELVACTDLPVSADLEKGFGHEPDMVMATVREAAAVGLAGCSIEDYSGHDEQPIYPFEQAVERVAAAVEAVRGLDHDFVFTARAENFLHGRRDLDDTIRRLQAFEQAGADVLYAPGIRDIESIRTLCAAVNRPVNVIMGAAGVQHSLAELADAGVKRVSLGSSMMRLAYGAMLEIGERMLEHGDFDYGERVPGFSRFDELLRKGH
jgi:2-methylisocitrate lyase-like PEP mutase family enzyme